MSRSKKSAELLDYRVLAFIYRQLIDTGRPPTQREIADALRVSRSRVRTQLRHLQERGLLEVEAGTVRGLRLTPRARSLVEKVRGQAEERLIDVPLLGDIVAGEPVRLGHDLHDFDQADRVPIPLRALEGDFIGVSPDVLPPGARAEVYACWMISDLPDALLKRGDIVLVQRAEWHEGELVLADAGDVGAIVGRVRRVGSDVEFLPESPLGRPLRVPATRVQTHGRVVGVIRLPNLYALSARGRLRVDSTVPEMVTVGRSFNLIVAVRHWTSPLLGAAEGEKAASGKLHLTWPVDARYVDLSLQVDSPECDIPGRARAVVRVFLDSDAPDLAFQLVPRSAGQLNISVTVSQLESGLVLGNVWLTTRAMSERQHEPPTLRTWSEDRLELPVYTRVEAALPEELLRRLQQTLLGCAPVSSHEELHDLFVDARINPWQPDLPETRTSRRRVDAVIGLLHDRFHAETRENALVSFLHVAAERLHKEDNCRQELVRMSVELRGHLGSVGPERR